jgi:hypothetical protein
MRKNYTTEWEWKYKVLSWEAQTDVASALTCHLIADIT